MKTNLPLPILFCAAALSFTGCAATNASGSAATHQAIKASPAYHAAKSPYDIPGYVTFLEDGRLWVFERGSEDLAKFMEHGEPAKMVVLPAAGPRGLTLKGTDRDTMMEFALTKPGFTVMMDDGRLWVFRSGSKELAQFMEHGEPAKMVVRPGAGPRGITLKSVDTGVLDAYQAL